MLELMPIKTMTREVSLLYIGKATTRNEYDADDAIRLVDKIYDDVDSRLCVNCKSHKDGVCVNDNSPLRWDFVDDAYGCVFFNRKDNGCGN